MTNIVVSNGYEVVSGSTAGIEIIASAVGHDGASGLTISGGTLTDDFVAAIATSATTGAAINLYDTVSGGTLFADGGSDSIAQIRLFADTLSGVTLETAGSGYIGVYAGPGIGSTTVIDGTVSRGAFIFDDGLLTFSGGSAGPGATFVAFGSGAVLTLSGVTLSGKETIDASVLGTVNISAGSGVNSFSAGSLLSASEDGTINIYGSTVNSGTISALAIGGLLGNAVGVSVNVYAGSSGTFINEKNAAMEANSTSGFNDVAGIYVSAGGAFTNSGTIKGTTVAGYDDVNYLQFGGGTFTNAQGATIAGSITGTGVAGYESQDLYGSAGFTNSGTITGSASNDADSSSNFTLIYTDAVRSTPVTSNAGTIAEYATASSYEGLAIQDTQLARNVHGGSGSLVNTGVIDTSATGFSEDSLAVYVGGGITNSGTIEDLVSDESDATGNNELDVYGARGGLTNSGTIDAGAGDDSSIVYFGIDAGSGGVTNSGSKAVIEAVASTDSYSNVQGSIADGGNLTNANVVDAIATAGSTALNEWAMDGGTVTNTHTMQALATAESRATFEVDDFNSAVNTGTFAATANVDSFAYASLDGGFIVNSKTMTATATAGSTAQLELSANGSGGTNALIDNTSAVTAVATTGSTAFVQIAAYGNSASIVNADLMEASVAGGSQATMTIEATGADSSLTNSGTIEAMAAVGTALVEIGVLVEQSSSGTLLAKETGGFAGVDLGNFDATVSGGFLQSIGANAVIGVIFGGAGAATDVTIVNGTNIVAWNDGGLVLTSIGIVSGSVLVQAALGGGVIVSGSVTNSGTIEALGLDKHNAGVIISAGSDGFISNTKTIESVATANYGDNVKVTVSAGTVINLETGSIEVLASEGSYGNDYVHVLGSSIINSGTILASASGSSDAYLTISGGTLTDNTGRILINATGESFASGLIGGSAVTNSGTIIVNADGSSEALLTISGATVANTSGTVSAGNGTIYLAGGATIDGGTLKTTGEGAILASAGQDGTIAGAAITAGSFVGATAGGDLTLANGTIISAGKAGSAVVEGYGNGGIVTVSGTIYDSGVLEAGGNGSGTVDVTSGGNVSGLAIVVGENGSVEVASGGSASVLFAADNGDLFIADRANSATAFGGYVIGFGGVLSEFPGQLIVLSGVTSGANVSANYTFSGFVPSGPLAGLAFGALTVTSNSTLVADINLIGDYPGGSAEFTVTKYGTDVAISDPGGGATLASTANARPPAAGTGSVALLGSYMASLFASPEGQAGAQTTADMAQSEAVITHPHAT